MKFSPPLLVAVALLAALSADAENIDWSLQYTAEALPTESIPKWTVDAADGEPQAQMGTSDVGSVLIQNLQNGSRASWRHIGGSGSGAFPITDSCTVEMRARIVHGTGYVLGLEVRNYWVGGVRLRVSQTGVELITNEGRKTVEMPIGDGFRVYRLTLAGNSSKLYVDNDPQPVAEAEGNAGDGTWVSFGECGHVRGTGEAEYNYVRATTLGAFAPEP